MKTETTLFYEHTFAAAHRLPGHKGHCKFIHGHNYKVTIELQNSEYNGRDVDMVVDFYDVKKLVSETIDEKFDHKLIMQVGDDDLTTNAPQGLSIFRMSNRPTTENIALLILNIINDRLPVILSCVAVTLEESPGKRVRVCRK